MNASLLPSIPLPQACGMMERGGTEHTAVLSHYQWWMKPEQSINGMPSAHSLECVSILVCVSYLTMCVCEIEKERERGTEGGLWKRTQSRAKNILVMQINHRAFSLTGWMEQKRKYVRNTFPVVWMYLARERSYHSSCPNCRGILTSFYSPTCNAVWQHNICLSDKDGLERNKRVGRWSI